MKRRLSTLLFVLGISFAALIAGTFMASRIPISLAFDDAWEEDAPDGDLDDISTGDDQMRQDKRAIRERMAIDHDWRSNETGITSIGYHKALHLIDQVNDTGVNATFYNKGGDLFYQDASANLIQLTSGGKIYVPGSALENAYPIGSIYVSTVSTNPGTSLGFGTWEAFGTGRVLVGIDAADTDFDVAEETGGAKNVTLTSAQSGLPAHNHGFSMLGDTVGTSNYPLPSNAGGAAYGSTTNNNTAADASEAHTNVQPYVVVYMWKRTA